MFMIPTARSHGSYQLRSQQSPLPKCVTTSLFMIMAQTDLQMADSLHKIPNVPRKACISLQVSAPCQCSVALWASHTCTASCVM